MWQREYKKNMNDKSIYVPKKESIKQNMAGSALYTCALVADSKADETRQDT